MVTPLSQVLVLYSTLLIFPIQLHRSKDFAQFGKVPDKKQDLRPYWRRDTVRLVR
jgi:hypothetical protein